jgi:hypothetical protein
MGDNHPEQHVSLYSHGIDASVLFRTKLHMMLQNSMITVQKKDGRELRMDPSNVPQESYINVSQLNLDEPFYVTLVIFPFLLVFKQF